MLRVTFSFKAFIELETFNFKVVLGCQNENSKTMQHQKVFLSLSSKRFLRCHVCTQTICTIFVLLQRYHLSKLNSAELFGLIRQTKIRMADSKRTMGLSLLKQSSLIEQNVDKFCLFVSLSLSVKSSNLQRKNKFGESKRQYLKKQQTVLSLTFSPYQTV